MFLYYDYSSLVGMFYPLLSYIILYVGIQGYQFFFYLHKSCIFKL